jgi:hypothetical protein
MGYYIYAGIWGNEIFAEQLKFNIGQAKINITVGQLVIIIIAITQTSQIILHLYKIISHSYKE